jgi:thiamine-phosphate pyrophosphorylase
MTTAKPAMAQFLAGGLYGITAEAHSLGRSNLEVVREMLRAGIKVIQYREKEKKLGAMYGQCLAIRDMTRQAGATFIVNDHVDLALLVDADGVHVGQEDLPPAAIRRLLGPDKILGLSTHGPDQALAAMENGFADYIGVGPLFATKTKKDVCAPVGLAYLDYVARNIALPFVAIGGIKEHNIAAVRRAGAGMIALVTEIVGAPDIPARVAAIRAAMDTP